MPPRFCLTCLAALTLTAHAHAQQTNAPAAPVTPLKVTEIASGLAHPWGLQFLPDGRMLVTEQPGRMRIVSPNGNLSPPVSGLPDVASSGQGGLLDCLLAPDFQTTGIIYFSFSEPRGWTKNGTSVARAKLTLTENGGQLSGVNLIFQQQPAIWSRYHFGSRLVWAPDGTLFITMGERASESASAQDLTTDLGKIARLKADGTVPDDNPFVGKPGVRPEIWSLGHRNVQGAAIDSSGRLWTTEHGPRGGDELNRPEAGKNYGWPVITYGIDYSGAPVGDGITEKAGLEQPVYYWKPSIGTSGLAFYNGNLFPGWKGNLLAGGLSGQVLERLVLSGGQVTGVEHLLADRGDRIRDVRVGPDGAVYVLTDDTNGKILKLEPAVQ